MSSAPLAKAASRAASRSAETMRSSPSSGSPRWWYRGCGRSETPPSICASAMNGPHPSGCPDSELASERMAAAAVSPSISKRSAKGAVRPSRSVSASGISTLSMTPPKRNSPRWSRAENSRATAAASTGSPASPADAGWKKASGRSCTTRSSGPACSMRMARSPWIAPLRGSTATSRAWLSTGGGAASPTTPWRMIPRSPSGAGWSGASSDGTGAAVGVSDACAGVPAPRPAATSPAPVTPLVSSPLVSSPPASSPLPSPGMQAASSRPPAAVTPERRTARRLCVGAAGWLGLSMWRCSLCPALEPGGAALPGSTNGTRDRGAIEAGRSLAYQMPSCIRTSSEAIVFGSQGGSQTRFTSTSSTPSICVSRW